MEGFLKEPEIFTHRRRRYGATRPYLVRHPKMVSVKFGGAKVKTIETSNTETPGEHVDTPRPQIFSNQELVDLSRQDC